ncbi:MAG: N-6 DNA methylase [Oscillospiraceae bacterium]|nr:N-6 DNA methylase [Oscillospiraceae bacterium]
MYISVNDAATKFNISKRRVQVLCEQGRISGAKMVSGVWLIPENAPKPIDGRRKHVDENQIAFFDLSPKALTVDDVCKVLSISKATAKNWIRLGKIIPDAGDQLFSAEYIERFVSELKSGDSTKLKSRRNKKSATGKILYKDYVRTASNQKLVTELLELCIFETEIDLLIVLANFAVQLYYQRHGIEYSDNNVLQEFLAKTHTDDFHILINDLIGNKAIDPLLIKKMLPALSKKIIFVRGEDSLGFVYISLRDIAQRKSAGAYYTPERVVNELIERLYENDADLKSRTFCDPCCGTGNFLLTLSTNGIDCSNIYGQDIDPTSVYLSRINIALMAPELSAADLYSRIIIGNTLFNTFAQKFDVIFGNPPWGSDFSEEDANRCRCLFETAASKSLEAYDLFVEKALTMLSANGVVAFVLPEAIMSVAVHDAVRRLLINSCSFKFITYLGNVFSGVQCPSIILGVASDGKRTAVGCRVSMGSKIFTILQPRDFSDGTLALNMSDEENACLEAILNVKNAVYLKENAKFALGIVTGNNKEYISNQRADDNEVVLKGSDIQRYSFASSGNYIRFAPEAFQQVAPTEMYRAKEKLLYRFICEVPVFAYDDKQTLSLNSCNIVIPEIDGLNMKYILAILNSSVAAYFISKKFNSVKLLRSHIEQMPIPVVSVDVQDEIIKKVDCIMNSGENISGLYEDLDNDIMMIFGLTPRHSAVIKCALHRKNLFLGV